jgi:hypothetical protein
MGTVILSQIPHPDTSRPITADNLTLVGMNHHVIRWTAMVVASLNRSGPCLPDLDGSVLGASYHPFPLAVKCDACDVSSVALKCQQRVRVRRLDIVKFDGMVASGGKVSLVRRDAETVHLGVRVLNCS